MFGSHLSIAGGLTNALDQARALGLDTVQIFTKNQQQWTARPLEDSAARAWLDALDALGWRDRTVSHASYLINLASPDPDLWAKSLDLMTVEIERCRALSIPFLVHHPGSHTGWTLDQGLDRIARAYAELFRRTPGAPVVSCLEGTVGSGRLIGGPFEHLARLRQAISDATGQPDRVGFCLDTCHMHAFGYDLSHRAAAEAHLDAFDRHCGLANVRVLHLNDSRAPMGSKRDLHAHIGEGTIGGGRPGAPASAARLASSGFAAFLQHPAFRHVPKILETPKGADPDGVDWDTHNLRRLHRLTGPRSADADARREPPARSNRRIKAGPPAPTRRR